MTVTGVRVLGTSGQPVLLLPGGANRRAGRRAARPAVVVTADRRATDAIRTAHARLADALGAPLVSWPGAVHDLHLDHPDETLTVVRDLVGRVTTGA